MYGDDRNADHGPLLASASERASLEHATKIPLLLHTASSPPPLPLVFSPPSECSLPHANASPAFICCLRFYSPFSYCYASARCQAHSRRKGHVMRRLHSERQGCYATGFRKRTRKRKCAFRRIHVHLSRRIRAHGCAQNVACLFRQSPKRPAGVVSDRLPLSSAVVAVPRVRACARASANVVSSSAVWARRGFSPYLGDARAFLIFAHAKTHLAPFSPPFSPFYPSTHTHTLMHACPPTLWTLRYFVFSRTCT